MPSQITVTGKTGPGNQVTSLVLTGLQSVKYDFGKQVVTVEHANGTREFDLGGVTTATIGISGSNYTLVMS